MSDKNKDVQSNFLLNWGQKTFKKVDQRTKEKNAANTKVLNSIKRK